MRSSRLSGPATFVSYLLPAAVAAGLAMASCGGAGVRPMRIAVATFSHETCTFCPDPTGIDDWEFYGPPMEGDAVLGMNDYIEGFVRRSREYGGVELVGISSPRDARGGSSGSWITNEAFEKYAGGIVEGLKNAGRLDGVYLSLHGAMAVTGIPKPEAELARRVRAAVGDIPIVVTLDLHANEDQELAEAADVVFIVKRYPHYDSAYQGERAARMMIRTIRGDYRPTMAVRKPGVITPSVYQGTGVSPAMEIMERARRWESRMVDAFVSVAFGFAYADVPDAGATVMVVTNDDPDLAAEIAEDMNAYIWRVREQFAGKKLPKTREGVGLAVAAAREGHTPVIIADHADRTGNSTHILAELIRVGAGRFCIATIADERAIEAVAEQGGEGARVTVDVGGYADVYAGEPVRISGTVEYLGPYDHFERVAVVKFGEGNRVILTPTLHQVMTPEIFTALGIPMEEMDIISLKSRVHFRRGFYETGLAGAIFEVDAPGLGPADLTTIDYRNVPKDLYPIYRKN